MSQNLFFPIYKQLEKELSELSYYISFDKKQLNVYSIKISDLLLRTVSEIENIAKELCKKENIKFLYKKSLILNLLVSGFYHIFYCFFFLQLLKLYLI